jgi:Extensin-like protein C-terminus
MIVALATWLKNDLQPSARRHLGSPIAKIETMSSYSCRNAYGRKRGNLSEHGRANALDIRSFVTAAMAESEVLAHWGPTTREVRAQVAAAKNAADKATAERAVASAKVPLRSTVAPGAPDPTTSTGTSVAGAVGTMIGSVPSIAARLPGVKPDTSLGWTPQSRLGGPKTADKGSDTSKPAGNSSGRTQFLRDAHTSACRIFGTVLGPEANDAHKNHFHVDMAERPNSSHYCE